MPLHFNKVYNRMVDRNGNCPDELRLGSDGTKCPNDPVGVGLHNFRAHRGIRVLNVDLCLQCERAEWIITKRMM